MWRSSPSLLLIAAYCGPQDGAKARGLRLGGACAWPRRRRRHRRRRCRRRGAASPAAWAAVTPAAALFSACPRRAHRFSTRQRQWQRQRRARGAEGRVLGNPPEHPVHDARRASPAVAGLVLPSLGGGADASASACLLAAAADVPDADAMVPAKSSASDPKRSSGGNLPPRRRRRRRTALSVGLQRGTFRLAEMGGHLLG